MKPGSHITIIILLVSIPMILFAQSLDVEEKKADYIIKLLVSAIVGLCGAIVWLAAQWVKQNKYNRVIHEEHKNEHKEETRTLIALARECIESNHNVARIVEKTNNNIDANTKSTDDMRKLLNDVHKDFIRANNK